MKLIHLPLVALIFCYPILGNAKNTMYLNWVEYNGTQDACLTAGEKALGELGFKFNEIFVFEAEVVAQNQNSEGGILCVSSKNIAFLTLSEPATPKSINTDPLIILKKHLKLN